MSAQESHLETFVGRYLETIGGDWDMIEPQVYDLLLPPDIQSSALGTPESGMLRIAFDPEAIPEHPGCQLASFGTPFVDGLLADALRRGRSARFYLVGLNLAPHDLAGKTRRAITLPVKCELRVDRARSLHFAQAVFWFQAEFVSDQKEQDIVPVAMDLHYGRQVRHLESLLEKARLAEEPAVPLPEVRRASAASVYPTAREEALRTFASFANVRNRELGQRCEMQVARMVRYYSDLRGELAEQGHKMREQADAAEKMASRRESIDREEQVRVSELRQKSSLLVHLRLLQLAVVLQPKLLIQAHILAPGRGPASIELVWDPLIESLEAAPCPECQRPSFCLDVARDGRVVCSLCSAKPIVKTKPGR